VRNRRLTPRTAGARGALAAAAASLCLAVAACGGTAPEARTQAPPSPTAGTVLDNPIDPAVLAMPLVDEQGRKVSLGALAGKTVVLTDFLTTCQEVCPMTSVNFRDAALAVRAAGLGDSVEFVEITVDPERDTPSRLAAYQKLFGAQPNWHFMTAGTATAALWKSLGVGYQKTPAENPAPTDWLTGRKLTYDVAHQDVVFVIDAAGHERWITQGNPSTDGHQPPATLNGFLNDEGRANLSAPSQPSWSARDIEAAVSYVTGKRVG
jgi:cytochrome oxidase Cu insertion factor (SCO1/SenC/PrrC family)